MADIDAMNAIQISSGKKSAMVKIPEAKFLNDVAVKGSDVYVSDTTINKVFVVQKSSSYKTFVEGPTTEAPNGVLPNGKNLLIAAWGPGLKADFSTERPGRVLEVDFKTKKITPWTEKPLGHLDGIELDGKDAVIVSD